jgi:hypothetical protein
MERCVEHCSPIEIMKQDGYILENFLVAIVTKKQVKFMLICLFIQYRLKFYHVINPKLLLAYFIFFPSRSLKSGVYSIYLRYLSIWIVHIQVNNSHSNYGLAQGWRNGNGT